MRIEVAQFSPRVGHVTVDGVGGSPASVLYLPIPRCVDGRVLDSFVHQLPSAMRRSVDAAVIRPPAGAHGNFMDDAGLIDRLQYRLEDLPLGVLHLREDGSHTVTALDDASRRAAPLAERNLLPNLRSADLRVLLGQPGVLLPESPDFHYEGPNGSHYTSFARAAFGLRSTAALEAVAFWLRPRVGPGTTVLVDAGAMLALGLQLATEVPSVRVESLLRTTIPRRKSSRASGAPTARYRAG